LCRRPLLVGFLVAFCSHVLQAQDGTGTSAGARPYRTLDDRYEVRRYTSLEQWQQRAAHLRTHILFSAGLLPMPERTPLNARLFDEQRHNDYAVLKVYFESLPGFFVTGNLYRPIGSGPFPAILSPHGHWDYGRLENTEVASVPGRAISLARQGFVVFSYDMIGYNDSRQLTHAFGGRREALWGLSLAGLQLWNSIRSLDFLQGLPDVDPDRIGATGASGGGTQTFLLAAVDERVKAAAPVNMISLHMQGGCLCENPPSLRLDTNNVELAALIAPRPLLMVSATGDWTAETPRREYPEMKKFYALTGADDHVRSVQFEAGHNYNRHSREAVYAWFARWLQGAPPDVRVVERDFRPDPLPNLLVFHGRSLPDGAVTAGQLTERWIASARRQVRDGDAGAFRAALRHAIALEPVPDTAAPDRRTVVVASRDATLAPALARAGFSPRPVELSGFDADAAADIKHFETYNRTPAGRRVAEIARALTAAPGAALVADGDAALAALLALAAVPVDRAVLDVGAFDTSTDDAFLERLYIPGLRRAGDLQTAAAMARGRIVIHNTGGVFELRGHTIEPRRLAVGEIIDLLKGPTW
jgi:hypothetical protein